MPRILLIFLLFVAKPATALAQEITVGTAVVHDPNIFEIYSPTSDRVTLFQLDASKSWGFPQTDLDLSYNGSVAFFSSVPSRNYAIHLLMVNLRFYMDEGKREEAGTGTAEHDSTETATDSTVVNSRASPTEEGGAVDSSGQFIDAAIEAGGQFDKSDFSQYDNSRISAILILRQPLGQRSSTRPSYSLSYNAYPNLSGLTNIENIFSLQLGTDALPDGWLAFTVQYGIKSYPTSATYTDTLSIGGQGKFGGGKKKSVTIQLNTPSVKQFMFGIDWNQKILPKTDLSGRFVHFGNPSTSARLLPQKLRGALKQSGNLGSFESHNSIFDDHYGYFGNSVFLQVEHSFPYSIVLVAGGQFKSKTYTVPAKDLDDSLVLAASREDLRYEASLNLSKIFSVAEGKSLKLQVEAEYLRNRSNAPYYEFDKLSFMIGLEFSF